MIEDKLRPVLSDLIGNRAKGVLEFHDDHIEEILSAKGSSHNHQNWEGGLHDHLFHCFVLAQDLYKILNERIGPGPYTQVGVYGGPETERGQMINGVYDLRPIALSLESAIIVLYFHDIEKILKYQLSRQKGLVFSPATRYPRRIVESKDAWYLGILPHKYGIEFDEQEYNALKYVHGEGEDYRKDERVASPLAGFVHSIDFLSSRVLWQIKNLNLPSNKIEPDHKNLYDICCKAVGKRVKYTGTNGDEYNRNHGLYVQGEGLCKSQHDSHGLCIVVQRDCGEVICVDPISVEILYNQ